MNCYRCGAWLLDHLVHLEDTPDGLYAVVDAPVADHVVECRCGVDVFVSSTRPRVVHPGQLRLVVPERTYETDYHGGTAHMSGAGDALVAHPGSVSGPIPIKEGHCA